MSGAHHACTSACSRARAATSWAGADPVCAMRERARVIQSLSASAFSVPVASSMKTSCCTNSSSAATRSGNSCGVAAAAACEFKG